ncbi:hypothetical protein NUSPORA_02027 [Nucleospora cyclopteri]
MEIYYQEYKLEEFKIEKLDLSEIVESISSVDESSKRPSKKIEKKGLITKILDCFYMTTTSFFIGTLLLFCIQIGILLYLYMKKFHLK